MSTNASPTPPIESFAYRIGGPIDFVISGGINAFAAWLVFYSASVVHLVGWHSVLMVSGCMFFILPLATTIFGFLSGVTQRRQGNFGANILHAPFLHPNLWAGQPRCRIALRGRSVYLP